MDYNMQMALMRERLTKTPEYAQLVSKVGQEQAYKMVTEKLIQDWGRGILVTYPAIVAAVASMAAVLPAIVPVASAGGLVSTSSAAAGLGSKSAQAAFRATSPQVTTWTRSASQMAAAGGFQMSPTKYGLVQILTSLGFGFGLVAGERISWEVMDEALKTEESEQKAAFQNEILRLGKYSDETLLSLGFSTDDISAIRRAYAVLLSEMAGGAGYDGLFSLDQSEVPGTASASAQAEQQEYGSDMQKAIKEWLSLYNQFVVQGLHPNDAAAQAESVYGWSIPDSMLNPILAQDLRKWQANQEALASSDLVEEGKESLPLNQQYTYWLNFYDKLVSQGLEPNMAASETAKVFGFSLPPEILNSVIAQDVFEAGDDVTDTPTEFEFGLDLGDVQDLITSELNQYFSDGEDLEPPLLDESDILVMPSGGNGSLSTRRIVPDMGFTVEGAEISPPNPLLETGGGEYFGESDMVFRGRRSTRRVGAAAPGATYKDGQGIWRWANSGKPVNGGGGGSRRRSYRRY